MRLKKEGSCINIENEVDAWSRKTGAHASLFRKRRAGRVPPNLPEAPPLGQDPALPPAEGSSSSVLPLGPEAEKSEPVARAWCRIPRRPEAHLRPARLAGAPPTPAPPAGDSLAHGPEAGKSEPVARAWCRISRRPETPAGRHPHPAPPGRSLIQTDAGPSCRRQPNLVPEVTQTLTGVLSPPEPEAPRPLGR